MQRVMAKILLIVIFSPANTVKYTFDYYFLSHYTSEALWSFQSSFHANDRSTIGS